MTSRDWNVLDVAMQEAPNKHIHEMEELNIDDFRQLFNSHAFVGESPKYGFYDLAREAADACKGLPLALEIIGRHLSNEKDETIWRETSQSLEVSTGMLESLSISYMSLPSEQVKFMFLDISCHMIGLEETAALEIWKSCDSCRWTCMTQIPTSITGHFEGKIIGKSGCQ